MFLPGMGFPYMTDHTFLFVLFNLTIQLGILQQQTGYFYK